MLAIKNSLMAGRAARGMNLNYASLSATIERLSSGLGVNSARDDVGGFAIRELMRVDIGAIKQGDRNALVK